MAINQQEDRFLHVMLPHTSTVHVHAAIWNSIQMAVIIQEYLYSDHEKHPWNESNIIYGYIYHMLPVIYCTNQGKLSHVSVHHSYSTHKNFIMQLYDALVII